MLNSDAELPNPRLCLHELRNPGFACMNCRIQADACIVYSLSFRLCPPVVLLVLLLSGECPVPSTQHSALAPDEMTGDVSESEDEVDKR